MLKLGHTVATPGALALLTSLGTHAGVYVDRHAAGDFGDLDDHDKAANEAAVKNGARVMSVYKLTDTKAVWVITEWDRSVTTVLLPSEY